MSHETEVLSSLPRTPTVGRIVHYGAVFGQGCGAAIIVRVFDTCVDLCAFPDTDKVTMRATSIEHGLASYEWHWPDECSQ